MPRGRKSTVNQDSQKEVEQDQTVEFDMSTVQGESTVLEQLIQDRTPAPIAAQMARFEAELEMQQQLHDLKRKHAEELKRREMEFSAEMERLRLGSGAPCMIPAPKTKREDGQPGLTEAQKQARKVVNSKLPKFSGLPEQWPLFYSAYQHSTEACGFSNIENLTRLVDCLEGAALEAVRSRLILPESVPDVIEDLRHLYGRPGRLLKNLLHQVQNTAPPREECFESFLDFGIKVKQLCDHITASALTEHLNNPLLVQELVEKLPASYQREWVRFKRGKQEVSLTLFNMYVSEVVEDVCELVDSSTKPRPSTSQSKTVGRKKEYVQLHNITDQSGTGVCWVCKQAGHLLKNCHSFKNMSLKQRLQVKEKLELCESCLRRKCNNRCKQTRRCNVGNCTAKHHPYFHRVVESVQLQNANGNADVNVIFRMIPVTLYYGGRCVDILAFVDEGSTATLLNEVAASKLQIADGVVEPLIISWTNDINRTENASRRLELMVSARGSKAQFPITMRTVTELLLPKQNSKFAEILQRYSHLKDLIVDYDLQTMPQMIIGLDNVNLFAPLESRIGLNGEPIAVKSVLGWTIYGPNKKKIACHAYLNLHAIEPMSNRELHEAMQAQYLLEEEVHNKANEFPESVEEKRARDILKTTTRKKGDRYETGLLWKQDGRKFPESFTMAESRMKSLERKLNKDAELRNKVQEMIADYLLKGYAHKLSEEECMRYPETQVWYLPLNVVKNPKKPGKVRLVWDAAATVGGVSLNSELLKGPDLLVPLPKVICRFRERSVAFGGDLQEMFHQLLIRDPDKQAQRFLYGRSKDGVPEKYILDVATFGAASSPCSAQYVKNLNAMEHIHTFPRAVKAILDHHYVDDYYDSVDSVEEAIELAKEVKYVHAQGGFNIRNWMSNSSKFLEAMGEKNSPSSYLFVDKAVEHERVLGIAWDPKEDSFYFGIGSQGYGEEQALGRPTKRKVFSFVMSQFDPMGFIAPVTVRGKMIIQDLWRNGCDWDAVIDQSTYNKWLRWLRLLQNVGTMSVPRSYFGTARSSEVSDIQLHIFSDASETAYGCAAYFRAVVGNEVRCALVMSRTKVAPIKQMSIPRLELLAAVLGARLARSVKENHGLHISKVLYWTDAKVVLSWIRSDQRRYKQFVGFRIGTILSLTNVCDWRWVPTKMNVADLLTKWGKDPDMTSNSEWVKGPQFLYEEEEHWPNHEIPPSNTTEELRVHLLLHRVNAPEIYVDASRFSKWKVLVRTIACLYRFLHNCWRKARGEPVEAVKATSQQQRHILPGRVASILTPLKQEEYEKAERLLVRKAQVEGYLDEYRILERNQKYPRDQWTALEKASPLYKLSTLMDQHGILRMEGRTANAESLPFDLRFPMILPNNHPITVLIVRNYHEKCGHGYRQAVKNELRQLYYIPHVDAVVRKVASSCVWCRVKRNRPEFPRMAPLPVQRLLPNMRPFSYTGVDFLGPFDVTIGRRHEKRWIALFTCMVVRAVHLEVAHGLSTQACLMAVRRFIGRRGWPVEFFSDNGTNFQGASKEITSTIAEIEHQWADQLTSARTKWTFNPPAAPHMGGVWERLVRSVKAAMSALDDGRRLTDEILQTVIVEAEEMINSRPLTTVVQEDGMEVVLTPNLFLRGYSSSDSRSLPTTDTKGALRDNYLRTQQLSNELWSRWIREYVPSINLRTKWHGETKPLKTGDLVFIVDGDNRNNWIRGIVEELIVAKDGRVRQAWIRTNSGRYRRATGKLAVLDLE